MSFDFLAGTWIYRSFRNLPEILPELDPNAPARDDITKWSRYMFGQGEMEFHPGYSGRLAGTFVMGPALEMDLAGSIVEHDGRVTVLWNAIGRDGQESEGWIYEYRGELVQNWPEGKNQTDAIVGTVIRSVNHNDLAPRATTDRIAPAGVVASFLMVRKRFKPANETIPLPGPVLQDLSSKHHRLHHLLWHFTRNMWDGLKPEQQTAIEALGWKPPRPLQNPIRGTAVERIRDNGAGEDFLYMHRQMLLRFRQKLSDLGLPPIEGWKEIPRPDRGSDNAGGFAIPPNWAQPKEADTKTFALIKSDEYKNARMMGA